MGTPDHISTEDWDVVHGFAVDIVNAPDSEKQHHRDRLLEFLNCVRPARCPYDPPKYSAIVTASEVPGAGTVRVSALNRYV